MIGDEYLSKTKSAVEHLFEGIEEYSEIVRRSVPPIYVSSGLMDNEAAMVAFEAWRGRNAEALTAAKVAQEELSAEWYAMAAICGALLEIATSGIRQCNAASQVPAAFADVIKAEQPAALFCVGRVVRSVPLGLVVYGARNQHTHHEDEGFRAVPTRVFELLATEHGIPGAEGIPDPAFDLQVRKLSTYAHNVTGLIEWRTYERYETDMREMLGGAA